MSDTPEGPGWWQPGDGPEKQSEGTTGAPGTPGAPITPGTPSSPTPPPQQPPSSPPPQFSAPPPSAPYEPPRGGGGSGEQKPAAPGEAFNYGWLKFQQNVGEILVVTVVAVLALIAFSVVSWIVSSVIWTAVIGHGHNVCSTNQFTGQVSCNGAGKVAGLFFAQFFITIFVSFFLLYLVQMMLIRGGLMITYGEKIEVKKILSTENLPQYALAAVIVAVVSTVLCCFGFVFFFFAQFFGFFILDKKMSALDGIKSSFQLVNKNLGTLIGFTIGVYIAFALGYVLCGIGLVVALPVVTIATAFMYRRLQGEPVAA